MARTSDRLTRTFRISFFDGSAEEVDWLPVDGWPGVNNWFSSLKIASRWSSSISSNKYWWNLRKFWKYSRFVPAWPAAFEIISASFFGDSGEKILSSPFKGFEKFDYQTMSYLTPTLAGGIFDDKKQ